MMSFVEIRIRLGIVTFKLIALSYVRSIDVQMMILLKDERALIIIKLFILRSVKV